jgi:hypothetical protein
VCKYIYLQSSYFINNRSLSQILQIKTFLCLLSANQLTFLNIKKHTFCIASDSCPSPWGGTPGNWKLPRRPPIKGGLWGTPPPRLEGAWNSSKLGQCDDCNQSTAFITYLCIIVSKNYNIKLLNARMRFSDCITATSSD